MERKRSRLILGIAVLLAGAALIIALPALLALPEEVRFAMELTPGWNLANALDAHGLGAGAGAPSVYETYWGAEPISAPMLNAIAKAGFRTVRLPVTWFEHMDASGNIDPAWMTRVQTVVDGALAAGLCVIVNAHHDPWYQPTPDNLSKAEATLRIVWRQIAEHFADYDDRLLFEGMNEPRLLGAESEWIGGTPEARDGLNRLNDAFVQTVRGSGGHNSTRYLLLPTYAASVREDALGSFAATADARIMVSVHLYAPYDFALNASGTAAWSLASAADTKEIRDAFHSLYWLFVRKGIPVVITEFGAMDKHNTEARAAWATFVTQLAKQAHIPYVWWDTSLLDQRALTWRYPQLVEVLVH
ncbi:MAG: glycoside hydrolase family 5 protein [Candidatus Limiplasma sp.]|nr:glycoside hydrolase family 5 protein [Candidatus Limiplasma sp.]